MGSFTVYALCHCEPSLAVSCVILIPHLRGGDNILSVGDEQEAGSGAIMLVPLLAEISMGAQ